MNKAEQTRDIKKKTLISVGVQDCVLPQKLIIHLCAAQGGKHRMTYLVSGA